MNISLLVNIIICDISHTHINVMNVIYYPKTNGEMPVKEFIDSQDKKMKSKIHIVINLLEEYGTNLPRRVSKYLGNDIFELRIEQSSNITYILYFFVSGDKAILTNGFLKKTEKTPKSEIEKAILRRKDYLERN